MQTTIIVSILLFIAAQAIATISIGVSIYTKIMAQLREFEVRISYIERKEGMILEKLEEIAENVTKIRIEVNNKQNRN